MKSATLKQFRPEAFLSQSGVGRAIVEVPKKKTLFSQGDPGDSVYYIQKGRARLSVVSGTGKEATVAVLGPGNFGYTAIKKNSPERVQELLRIIDYFAAPFGSEEYVQVRYGARDIDYKLDANGVPRAGWPAGGRPVCSAAGDQRAAALVESPPGGAIVIWQDGRSDNGDIYAQRIPDAESVDVDPAPATPALALAGAQPNPARGVVWAAFSLEGGQPGSLELFDLAGRRILARDVGGMGAGSHLVRLDPGAPLAPGHYVLRLRTAAAALSRQVVVIR